MTRHLTLVGHRKDGKLKTLARWCAWGEHWISVEDAWRAFTGADRTDGICPKHAREIEERNDLPPEPEAA